MERFPVCLETLIRLSFGLAIADPSQSLNEKRHGGSYIPRSSDSFKSTASNQTQNTNNDINAAHGQTQATESGQGGNQWNQAISGSTAQTKNVYLRPQSHGGGYIPKK